MSFFPRPALWLQGVPVLVGVAFLSTSAWAADLTRAELAASPAAADLAPQNYGLTDYLRQWHVVLGAGAMVTPEYEGGKEFKVLPVPFVSATFGDTVTVDPRGVSVNVYEIQGLRLGARLGYDLGRQEDDSDRLRGLGDIDVAAVAGVSLGYQFGPLQLYGALDKIIGGSDGLEAKVGVSTSKTFGRFTLEGGVSATWADDKYMESYFGVTPAQSLLSGHDVYDAQAGFKSVDLTAAVTYMVTANWMVRGQVGVGYLLGDAADSPVVEEKVQPSAMLSIGYKF